MIGLFEDLLQGLGKVFHLALHVDHSHACSIQMGSGLVIQLQPDLSQEHVWIFAKVGEISAGKFRENVLREALKANGLPDPRVGVFGYLAAANQLALFQKYPMAFLNGEQLAGLLGSFLEIAESWKMALQNGQSAPLNRPL